MSLPSWLGWLPFGRVPSVTPEQLRQSPERYLLIDVRTAAEYHKSHIPRAVSIPLHRFSTRQIRQIRADQPVLCICLSGHRSKPAVRQCLKAGIPSYELEGGMLAWWKQKPASAGDSQD